MIIPYENTIQLANDCAAKQDEANKLTGSINDFALIDPNFPGNTGGVTCVVAVSPLEDPIPCTTDNYPFYRLRIA